MDIRAILPLIILIEGFVSIAIEILAIRQLLPVAGGSVVVTSLIIGIFLLFLALGYQRGGQLAANLQKTLSRNFFIAAIWLGIGLSYTFIATFFYFIEKLAGPHIIYPLIAYLLLIIAPLIYILGQTVPITMNMVKQNQSAGSIGGNTLGLSTLGSFLGATLTTLFFMYYVGVAATIFANFILLLFLSLVLIEKRSALITQLVFTSAVIWIIYHFNIVMEKNFFHLTNNYANYYVQDQANSNLAPGEKILLINDARSSFTNNEKKGFPYIETIKKILFNDLHMRYGKILVLGAGGFSLSAENTFNNQFTYVDIDGQLQKVAIPHFISGKNGELIVDDARHYLKTTPQKYDAIIVDVYSYIKSIPAHLITKEYMVQIKETLTKKGVAIFNIIANPMLTDHYSKRIDNTIRTVFQSCMVIPQAYANQPTNILYVCQNSQNQDKQFYTDNFNNSTTDAFTW